MRPAPNGRTFVVIADNNTSPQESAIRATAEYVGIDVVYVHEPKRGYSSVRNAAIRAAMSTSADILLFIDDDWRPSPTLLDDYAREFAATGADILQGNTLGSAGTPRRRSNDRGPVKKAVGTYNVAFRRWLVADAGVSFDPRLDLVGFEDREFFLACHRAGGIALYANSAMVLSPPGDELDLAAQRDLKTFAEAAACNKIAVEMLLHGRLSSLLLYVRSYLMRGIAGTCALAGAALLMRLNRPFGERLAAGADLMVRKHRGAWTGLMTGSGYDRSAARSGRLIQTGWPAPEPQRARVEPGG